MNKKIRLLKKFKEKKSFSSQTIGNVTNDANVPGKILISNSKTSRKI